MAYLEFDQLCKGVARHDLLVLRIGPNLGDQDGEDLGLHLQVALEDVNGVAEDVAELIRFSLVQQELDALALCQVLLDRKFLDLFFRLRKVGKKS